MNRQINSKRDGSGNRAADNPLPTNKSSDVPRKAASRGATLANRSPAAAQAAVFNGYDCPCCGKFIVTTREQRRRDCPHCDATISRQAEERYGLTVEDLPGGIFDDREGH